MKYLEIASKGAEHPPRCDLPNRLSQELELEEADVAQLRIQDATDGLLVGGDHVFCDRFRVSSHLAVHGIWHGCAQLQIGKTIRTHLSGVFSCFVEGVINEVVQAILVGRLGSR